MSKPLRLALVFAAVPIALWVWVGAVFAMDRASDRGEVLGKVTIGDVALGGLDQSEALEAIRSVEAALGAEPILVTIDGTEFTLVPSQVGFDLDEEALLDQAMRIGRPGGFLSDMNWWVRHLGGGDTQRLEIEGTYSRPALEGLLAMWEGQAINDPPQEGGITVTGGEIVPVYPKAGTGLAVSATADLIEAEILGERMPVTAVTEYRTPTLQAAAIDLTVDRARTLVSGPVTLAKIIPEITLTIPPEVLMQSIASRVVGPADDPEVDLFFQIGPLVQYLNPIRAEVETEPVDAQIVIRPDDVPLILPGHSAFLVDDGRLPDAVMQAATSVTRTAPLPTRDGTPPTFTTAEAEALGIRNLLYTATTFYPCCGDEKNRNRIINIHRIADEVNGAIVLPGETFSLNEHVGRRTIEDGYRAAGAIVGPIVYCCDHPANIGGGVSQFATTLYNAVFWSGLEDIAHSPHSLYIKRYPMVREATLGWPTPDIVFRNDTEYGIYIKTEYTDDSITVKFFGDNGGIIVESETSEKRNLVAPSEYLEPDPTVHPGEPQETDDGEAGFTADVTRTITYPDGTVKTRKWTWTYDPHPIRILVHPCELPEDHVQYEPTPCPVKVPSLGNLTASEAKTVLQGLGLVYAEGPPFEVNDPLMVGTVRAHTPGPETWLEVGETVTVRIGVLVEE